MDKLDTNKVDNICQFGLELVCFFQEIKEVIALPTKYLFAIFSAQRSIEINIIPQVHVHQ